MYPINFLRFFKYVRSPLVIYSKNRFGSTNVRCRTHSTNDDGDGDDNYENFDNIHVIVLFYGFIFHSPPKENKMPELS
jgi:hypothetical protein